MNMLYDVYTHPKNGAWGVNVAGTTISTAHVVDGRLFLGELAPYKLAAEVAKKMRTGFTKLPRAKYLKVSGDGHNGNVGSFIDRHPELLTEEGIVVFTTKGIGEDFESVFQEWEEALEKTDARPEQIERWLSEVRGARQYITAPRVHPAFCLLVADWAIQQGRLLIGEVEGVPQKTPRNSPMEWEEWIHHSFSDKQKIRTALEQLGWSLRDALMGNAATIQETNDEATGWFADASSVAF